MASPTVNVLRWSALAFGVFYGFSHQMTITASQKIQHEKHEYDSKQKIIDQARAEYQKKKAPPPSSTDGVVTDPADPKFDVEKLLMSLNEQKA